MLKNKKGFTLIELLIVIGIVAILAAAVIIAINPGEQFKQARNATRWSHMNAIANGVYSYAISAGGNFPDCNHDAVSALTSLTVGDGTARDIYHCEDDLVDTYLSALPLDPSESGKTNTDCDPDAGAVTDCTGYTIESDGTRITIRSKATEAATIIVVQ